MMRATARLGLLLVPALVACADAADREIAPVADTTAAAAPVAAAAPAAPAEAGSGFVDPDSATREALLLVPGIDAAAADALIAARPFPDMLSVDRALQGHVDEAQRDSVYMRLWKPIDLNSASAEEIELIPGVGPRMRHEFEEYRPYRSMEQFRREIGKYVDDTEVARLERYVMLP